LESNALSTPFLSIIIPAHNEENRLPHTLDEVFRFLKEQTYTAEVIVVENGSQDRTLEVARSYEAACPQLRILQETRRGKGLAVKKGMLAAWGEYRFMCDADFSMPVDEINKFLPPQLVGYPIAIASREAPGAKRYGEPAYRHIVGRIFNTMIRTIALPGLHDTQCGFKCFHAPVAEILFRQQTLSGFSFDVEVLFIARQLGYPIVEIPVPWYFNPESKVSVLRDSLKMALDLIVIRLNGLRGRYRVGYGAEV
jgi:glycosyltransferase involved in cell wall biosynthesis